MYKFECMFLLFGIVEFICCNLSGYGVVNLIGFLLYVFIILRLGCIVGCVVWFCVVCCWSEILYGVCVCDV